MQGLKDFIPTADKVRYLNKLLKVGFHTLDFGSFVSPKAIPQMRDTEAVLAELDWEDSPTRLLAIVANLRGAEKAASLPGVAYLGYPFSVSETFQMRNTRKTIAESRDLVREMLEVCQREGKTLVVYVSMGFGNPYREAWSAQKVADFCTQLVDMGVKILSLSDTIGTSNPQSIDHLFGTLIPAFPQVKFGAHLHTTPGTWREKVEAAFAAGCRRFDGAIKGFGGCPMAADDLVGNMPMERLVTFAQEVKLHGKLNLLAFESAYNEALRVFPSRD